MEERDRLPCGLLDEIIAARAYGRAVETNTADPKGWESSPLRMLAKEIEHELAKEEIETTGDG